MPDLSIKISSLYLKNPVILASGTCGYGIELKDLIDLNSLGGLCLKGISLKPRPGNPPPRIHETASGLLNSIGLENVGIDRFISEKLPLLKDYDTCIIANILGDSARQYIELAQRLDAHHDQIKAIELNLSCPNVKCGGIAFGTDPKLISQIITGVKKVTNLPVIAKLSPNVQDIVPIATACEESGADAISLINTLLGTAIDIFRKKPVFNNIFAGLSGPAIKPVALRFVWQASHAVKIPIIGIGGISKWEDAIEFFMAGATAIQIGTANFFNPSASFQIIHGIEGFMRKMGYKKIEDMRI